jgi:hypothetical protein
MNDDKRELLDHVLAPENQAETVALARAVCPFAEEASDALMLICVAMVEARGDVKAVAAYLGFHKSRVRQHLQSRLSGRIIQKIASEQLRGMGYLTAVSTLMDVAESQSQTGNARTNAAKLLIELGAAEMEKRSDKGEDTKDLNAMTLKELESYVNSIKQDLIRLPAQDTDMIDA